MPVTPKLFGMLERMPSTAVPCSGPPKRSGRQLGLEDAQRGYAQILMCQGPVIFDIGERHALGVAALDVGNGADAGRRLALVTLQRCEVRRGRARGVALGQGIGGFGDGINRRRGGPESRPRIFDEGQGIQIVGDLGGAHRRRQLDDEILAEIGKLTPGAALPVIPVALELLGRRFEQRRHRRLGDARLPQHIIEEIGLAAAHAGQLLDR